MTAREDKSSGQALASIGLLVLAAAFVLLAAGLPWAGTFFYLPAWAGVILFLDGVNNRLSGSSLLLTEPARFAGLYLVSIPCWLFYEVLNLRLRNWSYERLPEELALRWLGYALAFGTVLPALAEARQLAEKTLPLGKVETPAFRLTPGTRRALSVSGAVFLLLPMLAPEIFFPLVWGAAFLLFEPALERRVPGESWLFELSLGRAEAFLGWCVSGLVCGLLWEALNWWAGGRWTYSVPGPMGPKLFEMPLAGYLGFVPFALGCASAAGLASWAWGRATLGTRAQWVFLLAFFAGAVFTLIDLHTARSFVRVLP